MARPTVTATTERTYSRLPAFYREADADQHVGDPEHYPLLRYLSAAGDRAAEDETLLDRVDAGELVDPDLADADWLWWLAQLVGVKLSAALTEAEQRDAIRYASSGWRAGTKTAVADAAKTVLTGTKYASVLDHAKSRATAGSDTMWDVLIVTRDSETPDVALVLETVRAKGAKPAGVVLWHETYEAAWYQVEATHETWADWNTLTWRQLEETLWTGLYGGDADDADAAYTRTVDGGAAGTTTWTKTYDGGTASA